MVMGMTRVNEVAYITVGVGDLKITNTSDGNGELILKWFSVRDFHRERYKAVKVVLKEWRKANNAEPEICVSFMAIMIIQFQTQ